MTDTDGAGLFVISIDVEMAWGAVHHGKAPVAGSLYDQERRSVAAVLALMERYEISATWAVVGHLFLDRCEPVDGTPHPDVRRARYPWFRGDWFDVDPVSTLAEDPWWYGADLVEAIKDCAVPQEIGSHSFSHQIVGDPEAVWYSILDRWSHGPPLITSPTSITMFVAMLFSHTFTVPVPFTKTVKDRNGFGYLRSTFVPVSPKPNRWPADCATWVL